MCDFLLEEGFSPALFPECNHCNVYGIFFFFGVEISIASDKTPIVRSQPVI